MQLKNFSLFLKPIFREAERLQNHDLAGNKITKPKVTHTHLVSFFLGVAAALFLKRGFSDNFAGYTISFLGIFIGLFTTIIISLFEKKDQMISKYELSDQNEKLRLVKFKNYQLQFTALVSYSIVIALLIICLLFGVLLFSQSRADLRNYTFIANKDELSITSLWLFCKASLLYLHRFIVVYLLSRFLTTTLFSVASYFSFIISEYKRLRLTGKKVV